MANYAYLASLPKGGTGEGPDFELQAVKAFAIAQGWPAGLKSAQTVREPTPGGPVLADLISRLGKGDVLAWMGISVDPNPDLEASGLRRPEFGHPREVNHYPGVRNRVRG